MNSILKQIIDSRLTEVLEDNEKSCITLKKALESFESNAREYKTTEQYDRAKKYFEIRLRLTKLEGMVMKAVGSSAKMDYVNKISDKYFELNSEFLEDSLFMTENGYLSEENYRQDCDEAKNAWTQLKRLIYLYSL